MNWEIEGTGPGIRLTIDGQTFDMEDAEAVELAETVLEFIEEDDDEEDDSPAAAIEEYDDDEEDDEDEDET